MTFTTLYPNTQQPHHGVFVENRLRHIIATGQVSSTVLAPVPWYPAWAPDVRQWGQHAKIGHLEQRHGLTVHHPRYLAIPWFGMNIAPALLAACAHRWLATQKHNRFDLIDAHYVYPDGVAALLLARRLGRRLVITARGSDVTQLPDHPGPRAMIRYTLRRADALIAVSAALGARLVALGADPARVHVLRNGVDLTRFCPPAETRPRGAELLSVGHLIARKGHERVIAALARLPTAARLTIVGEGPLESELRRLAARLGVVERVRFAGVLPPEEMPRMYGTADILVLASSREGWANVLLEAMACGTPVVASPIAGNDEVVRSGAAGLLAEANTVEALAKAIARLLAAPPDRSATRAYAEGFGWTSVAEAQVQLYRKVLA